jgi:hypothetical protein
MREKAMSAAEFPRASLALSGNPATSLTRRMTAKLLLRKPELPYGQQISGKVPFAKRGQAKETGLVPFACGILSRFRVSNVAGSRPPISVGGASPPCPRRSERERQNVKIASMPKIASSTGKSSMVGEPHW